ncbi:hypothetical protein MTO96_005557 [Rhipicephalus appendiculatus]
MSTAEELSSMPRSRPVQNASLRRSGTTQDQCWNVDKPLGIVGSERKASGSRQGDAVKGHRGNAYGLERIIRPQETPFESPTVQLCKNLFALESSTSSSSF